MPTATGELISEDLRARCLEAARALVPENRLLTPPFGVQGLLKSLEIYEIRERPLDRDARLVWSDGRLVIEVNPLFPRTRRRLSIAHEIGHLLINMCTDSDPACPAHSNSDYESLCNCIAGELLAPEWAIARFFGNYQPLGPWQEAIRCSTLLAAASAFAISIDSMACRVLHDLSLAPQTIGIVWRYLPNSYAEGSSRALRVASAWHSIKGLGFIPLNKTAPQESIIVKAFAEDGVYRRQENLRLGGLTGEFTVEAMGFGTRSVPRAAPTSRGVLALLAA